MIDVPIQVKDALREGRLRKNYRFQVLNDDGTVDFTIDNNNLVSESVNIDERMCSGDQIKYGLCEGSSLEFQYFGKENITGRQLKVFVDVEYGESTPYAIPMGYFTVKNCSRQASTGIIKAVCYNKLQSDYLDAKANMLITDLFDNPEQPIITYNIRTLLLNNYEINDIDYRSVEIEKSEATRQNVCKLSGGAINFRARYGIDNPLNYCMFTGATGSSSGSTTAYLYVQPNVMSARLNPEKCYFLDGYTDLELFEQHWFESISDLISSAFNVSGDYMNRFINPQTSSSSAYNAYLGWHNFLGVCIDKSDGTKEWYSNIAFNAGLQNVVGTFSDLDKTIIYDATQITVYTPYAILVSSSNSTYDTTNFCRYDFQEYSPTQKEHIYFYFADSSMSNPGSMVQSSYLYLDVNGTPISGTMMYRTWWIWLYMYINNFSPADLISVVPSQMADFTLREIISASYETVCQFGQLDRVTDLFSGVELNHSRLLPADTLYPDNALYPNGAQESAFRSQYSKLWADEGNVRKWRYLIITYKGLDENQQEKDFTLQRTVNADGTDDYNCSDNWLFRNLIWTATDIGSYADAMVLKMRDITWFPFEMWCAGLPYLETGDEIEIPLGEDTYTSYILQRQLKGIQNLQDTYINGTLDIF